jgi:2'-5' RNA ligase
VPADRRAESTERPATARVFFALWPPAEVADRLAAMADDAAHRFGGRATRRETIHLTLAFLGDVPESRLAELAEVAAGVQGAAFELSLDHLGYWQHNHLLWAGGKKPAALNALHGALSKALVGNGFKVDGEGRNFVPHVTLVRKLPPACQLAAEQEMPLPALAWPCQRFFLVRSRLSSSGSEYLILRDFLLA